MAYERLLPLLSNRVPGAVWWMDRDHVGLYGGCWTAPLHPGLHAGHGDWEPGGKSTSWLLYMFLPLMQTRWLFLLHRVVWIRVLKRNSREVCIFFDVPSWLGDRLFPLGQLDSVWSVQTQSTHVPYCQQTDLRARTLRHPLSAWPFLHGFHHLAMFLFVSLCLSLSLSGLVHGFLSILLFVILFASPQCAYSLALIRHCFSAFPG